MELRELVGYSPWSHKRIGCDLATKQQQSIVCSLGGVATSITFRRLSKSGWLVILVEAHLSCYQNESWSYPNETILQNFLKVKVKCLCMFGNMDTHIMIQGIIVFFPIRQIPMPWRKNQDYVSSKGQTCFENGLNSLTAYGIKTTLFAVCVRLREGFLSSMSSSQRPQKAKERKLRGELKRCRLS